MLRLYWVHNCLWIRDCVGITLVPIAFRLCEETLRKKLDFRLLDACVVSWTYVHIRNIAIIRVEAVAFIDAVTIGRIACPTPILAALTTTWCRNTYGRNGKYTLMIVLLWACAWLYVRQTLHMKRGLASVWPSHCTQRTQYGSCSTIVWIIESTDRNGRFLSFSKSLQTKHSPNLVSTHDSQI